MGLTALNLAAKLALSYMEHRTVTRGGPPTEIWTYKDDHPKWMEEMAYESHSDMLPDDHRFEFIRDALDYLATEDNDPDDFDSEDGVAGYVDIYNHTLLAWLSSNLHRMAYVDEWVSEYGWPEDGLAGAMQVGQRGERVEVFSLVREWLESRLSEDIDGDAEWDPLRRQWTEE